MTTIRHPDLDDTWRLVTRFFYMGDWPELQYKDCYLFRKLGGTNPSHEYSESIITIEKFWGA